MAVESAEDLEGLFEKEEFAEPAEYTAPGGGAASLCSVIVDRGQGRQPFRAGESSVAISERMLSVQKSEVELVARAGLFTMLDENGVPTSEKFKVAALPKLDHTASVWSVELLLA